MGSFEYSTIDFENVTDVRLVGGCVTGSDRSDGGSTASSSSDSLTQEQQRKRQLIKFRSDDFDDFDRLVTSLMMMWEDFSPDDPAWIKEISHITGVPDYINCRNCREYGEESGSSGADICLASGVENEDGETRYLVIEGSEYGLPEFCEASMRAGCISFPERLLTKLPPDVFQPAWEKAKDDIEDAARRHVERRKQALEEGDTDSRYVTEPIDEWVMTREEYAARNVGRLVSSLFIPRSRKSFRSSALKFAWNRALDDVLTEDYHRSRAEAYLRALDSSVAEDTKPGEGGLEFERDVREFIESIGWPIRDRVFEIETETGETVRNKEADIHTEIDDTPALIEVYTRGAHQDKDRQLADYRELYRRATGDDPLTIELSDRVYHAELSRSLFETLLNLDVGGIETPPDESRSFSTDDPRSQALAGQLEPGEFDYPITVTDGDVEAGSNEYEDICHSPSDSCIAVEREVEQLLRERGCEPSKPYSTLPEMRPFSYSLRSRDRPEWHTIHAVGPTVRLPYDPASNDEMLVAFHGDRSSPVTIGDGPADEEEMRGWSGPRAWRSWLAGALKCEYVNVVQIHDDSDGRNALSPRLLAALLMLNSPNTL